MMEKYLDAKTSPLSKVLMLLLIRRKAGFLLTSCSIFATISPQFFGEFSKKGEKMALFGSVRFVWHGGFPQGIELVAGSAYLLTIESLEVTASDLYGTIRVVLVPDGEYACWREACEQEVLVQNFSRSWDAVEWLEQDRMLMCGFFIPSGLNRQRTEEWLADRYTWFLAEAGINPLTPDLIPDMEWLGDG
jgi:hypothetical protein